MSCIHCGGNIIIVSSNTYESCLRCGAKWVSTKKSDVKVRCW